MDPQWQAWTRHNLERGCNPVDIVAILQRNGFSHADIQAAMSGQAAVQTPDLAIDYGALAQPALVQNPSAVGARAIADGSLQLFEIPNFLDAAHCQGICALIDAWLRPSTVTTGDLHTGFRTSQTCDLGQMQDPLVADVDHRIACALGLNPAWAEATQGQKYAVGQEFKAHTDYFEPNTPEYAKYAGARGQRSWTFMIYLNDTEAGGATHFTHLNRSFYPRRGTALVWNNLHPDGTPNPATEHHGMPVEAGTKSIITKWFRDRGPGPMGI